MNVLHLSAANSVFLGPPDPLGLFAANPRDPLNLSGANPRAIARLKAQGCKFGDCPPAPERKPVILDAAAIYASRRVELRAPVTPNDAQLDPAAIYAARRPRTQQET